MQDKIRFYKDENEYTKNDLDFALETLYKNEINGTPQDNRLTRDNTGIEYSILYKDCRYAIKYIYEQMKINKTGKGLKDEIEDKIIEHSNSNSIRKIISKYYQYLPGIEYPDKAKEKIQKEYKAFLLEKYKEQYEKDSSLFSDPFYVYNHKNKFKKYGIYFWKILDNDRNLAKYKEALKSVFSERAHERGKDFPQGHAQNYFHKFLKLKEFFDTKYHGYINWIKQNGNNTEEKKYYVVSQTNYYVEHKQKGILRSTAQKEHRRMRELKPNDIILSFNNGRIKDIIVVKDLPIIDEDNNSITVNVQYNEIPKDKILSRKDIRIKIPEKLYMEMTEPDFPFCKPNGAYDCKIKQRGYLFYITKECFDILTNGINSNFINEIPQSGLIDIENGDNKMTQQPLNQILYGPPGTGKTYSIKDYIKKILKDTQFESVKKNNIKSDNIEYFNIFEQPWYIAIAYTLYENSEGLTVPDISEKMKDYIDIKNHKKPKNKLWQVLQAHAAENSLTIHVNSKQQPYIFDKDIDSKWYLTDIGKNYIQDLIYSKNMSTESEEEKNYLNTQNYSIEKFVEYITFHQSYSYEEFVEGIKPVIGFDGHNNISYEYNKGIFKEMCIKANSDPDNNYVLVIDEINRGNISKIFGELITLIEEDKRIKPNGENDPEDSNMEINSESMCYETSLKVKLPYTKQEFGVPRNLYIIGTMNTADRSIALLDTALRRRFDFVEMMPQENLINDTLSDELKKDYDLSTFLKNLNNKISTQLGDDNYKIGHAYLMNLKTENDLERAICNKIFPLLQEYFYNEKKDLKNIVGFCSLSELKKDKNWKNFINKYSKKEDNSD